MREQLLAAAAALVLYPGFVASALVGGLAELAWGRLRSRPLPDPRSALQPLPAFAAILALLAAVQIAAPFNPLPAGDRNALVAAMALLTAASLLRDPAPGLLVAQVCWLLAVLLPAIVPESLRPQVLGAAALVQLLPLKIVCAVLYVGALPTLLELDAPRGVAATRTLLWLPAAGLLASILFQPAADDFPGLARFAGETLAVLVVILAFAALAPRIGRRSLARWGVPAAGLAVLVAVVTVIVR